MLKTAVVFTYLAKHHIIAATRLWCGISYLDSGGVFRLAATTTTTIVATPTSITAATTLLLEPQRLRIFFFLFFFIFFWDGTGRRLSSLVVGFLLFLS